MKKFMNKVNILAGSAAFALMNTVNAYAELNEDGLRSWIRGFVDPLQRIALVLVPIVSAVYVAVEYFRYLRAKSEGENPKPFWTTISNVVIGAVLVESFLIILGFFGVN